MSIKVMTVVWNTSLPHAEKIVLLALADIASDEGTRCYPSIETLRRKCGLEERSVQRIISRLAQAGHITLHKRAGHSTNYTVHPRPTVTPDGKSPPTQGHPTPDGKSPPPPTEGHPTPDPGSPISVIDPSVEPSREPPARARSTMIRLTAFEQEVVDTYHRLLPNLPEVKGWTRRRRELLNTCIADAKQRGKDASVAGYWAKFFAIAARSDFLCGRAKTDFIADLE
jgi:hypothetical protein